MRYKQKHYAVARRRRKHKADTAKGVQSNVALAVWLLALQAELEVRRSTVPPPTTPEEQQEQEQQVRQERRQQF